MQICKFFPKISYVFYCFQILMYFIVFKFLCISLFYIFCILLFCFLSFIISTNDSIWGKRQNTDCFETTLLIILMPFTHKSIEVAIFCLHSSRKYAITPQPYTRSSRKGSQIIREMLKKKVIKFQGEIFLRCDVIAKNVEGGLQQPPRAI